jgi:SAM-dependent methyltransferase
MSEDYTAETYGERWADIYDDWTAGLGLLIDGETIASRLADMAGEGPALELAIGTGRVALPLTEMGVEVHGVDISESMVARLRAKPGGADLPVTMGDFADVPVEGRFPLIYLVFNTIFALLTQEDQVRCFANVARHLNDDGVFVIEAFLPDLTRFNQGQRFETLEVGVDSAVLLASRHDPGTQTIRVLQMRIEEGKPIATYPVHLRYCFPSELDLMARLGGMRLRDRWGGWDREPYTGLNARHVSVYELDPGS